MHIGTSTPRSFSCAAYASLILHQHWGFCFTNNRLPCLRATSEDTCGSFGAVNIDYNLLNLPRNISGAKTIAYTYDAQGDKLRRVSPGTGNTDYIGGIQYEGTTTSTISFIQTEEGRAFASGGTYNYEYHLTDHLGNTRLAFVSQNGTATVVQKDDYYAFGMEINSSVASPKNNYLYNKKELQEELGQYDYGARFYDPVIGRWTTVDPLADMHQEITPYNYVLNNPLSYRDAFGLDTLKEVQITATKIVRQIMDLSLYISRPWPLPRNIFKKPERTDVAENFEGMAYNAIVTQSKKTVLSGNLINKLKNDPAFQAWRKKIIAQYKANPILKHYLTTMKFGGQPFFSTNGDTEVKLSVRGAVVTADFTPSDGGITVNFQVNDTFDLDYQAGRGAVYNGINGFLKPIWVGVFDGKPDMKVEGNWSETIKQ